MAANMRRSPLMLQRRLQLTSRLTPAARRVEFGMRTQLHIILASGGRKSPGDSNREKPGAAFWAAVVVALGLVAVAAYVSAYAWMVKPVPTAFSMHGPVERLDPDYTGTIVFAEGTRDQEFWERVFGPAHWVDRRVRRDTWSLH